MKKILSLLLSVLLMSSLAVMPAFAEGETVSVIFGGTPASLDPAFITDVDGMSTAYLAFCGLMGTRVVDGETVSKQPEMAESYTISEDGCVYTFTLRENLRWSDGSDFFASDFVKSWNRAVDEKLGASYSYLFNCIARNADGTLNVVADDAARTLTVTLTAPCSYFLEMCTMTIFCPVKTELADETGAWAIDPEKCIGTGPFRLTSYAVDDAAVFEKNPYYWNAENVSLGGVRTCFSEDPVAILAAYESGAVSYISGIDPEEYERICATYPDEIHSQPQLGNMFIVFNVYMDLSPESKALTVSEQSAVRNALGLLINRQEIVEYILNGEQPAATGYFPVGLSDGYNDNVREADGYSLWYMYTDTPSSINENYTEDQVEAINTLIDLGYAYTGSVEGGDIKFTDFPTFEYTFKGGGSGATLAQYIQECWNRVGITALLNVDAHATYLMRMNRGELSATFTGWIGDYNDACTFLDVFKSDSGNNSARLGRTAGTYTKYTDTTADAGTGAYWGLEGNQTWAECYDALVARIETETDPENRARLCADAERVLMSTGAVIPLYFRTFNYLCSSDIHNLGVLPTEWIIWNYVTVG